MRRRARGTPGVRRNEGKLDFMALVLKFEFEGEVTFTFCKMRWQVGVMTVTMNFHSFVSKANERNAIYGKISV